MGDQLGVQYSQADEDVCRKCIKEIRNLTNQRICQKLLWVKLETENYTHKFALQWKSWVEIFPTNQFSKKCLGSVLRGSVNKSLDKSVALIWLMPQIYINIYHEWCYLIKHLRFPRTLLFCTHIMLIRLITWVTHTMHYASISSIKDLKYLKMWRPSLCSILIKYTSIKF